MLNFEQVKLLEAKVAKAIEYVERINREKSTLFQRESELRGRLESYQRQETELKAQLDSYQGRIDELEVLVARFKEDQDKIEEGILSALDRLNKFERDIDKSLKGNPDSQAEGNAGTEHLQAEASAEVSESESDSDPGYNIEEQVQEDIPDPLLYTPDGDEDSDDSQEKGGELDIF